MIDSYKRQLIYPKRFCEYYENILIIFYEYLVLVAKISIIN